MGTITQALKEGGKPLPVFLKIEATQFKDPYHGESERKTQVRFNTGLMVPRAVKCARAPHS